MQIILLDKVVNLGNLGDVVKVKDGYARNFLIPSGRARRATEAAIQEFEARRAELEKAAAEKARAAERARAAEKAKADERAKAEEQRAKAAADAAAALAQQPAKERLIQYPRVP